MTSKNSPVTLAGTTVHPGEVRKIELPVVKLYTDTQMSIPVQVHCGKQAGPTLFLSAAIHGDELNGVEIIQRLINSRAMQKVRGTVLAVPMVNVYGVLNQTRYLPDRRDLNRSFPGSSRGSLAARMADLFLREIVQRCDYGIDFHTGAIHRSNLPQIRADLSDDDTKRLASAFGVPVILNANVRDGSLRQSAAEEGAKVLLYEAGEALRFDELAIRAGVRGTLNVMRALGMLPASRRKPSYEPVEAHYSRWLRATDSGFIRHRKQLGDQVERGDILADIVDPYGTLLDSIITKQDGIIIGKQNIPLVQEGEAVYHIACFSQPDEVSDNWEQFQDDLLPDTD
ncbi:deacylase [Bacterioplanes sanyensis]|uniref:succinylglutamate desuccinylase/aspartoacylase family protein n=1 Tax=Bacterioplanes sanyensis TaxID=1249553 RepID=UPI0016771614|nr:succinylglutamate desuccinylase/aspartoacylase family protein [Bacterioplanes sanyensis]GGY55846.1 deacylase [Bacterioplanes sanyensis]